MKIHLIKKQTIEEYASDHSGSKRSLAEWFNKMKYADWNRPSDIEHTFGSADLLGGGCDRVVFNIGGNHYRMICKYAFGDKQVHLFVCWIGTHAEYDEICNGNKQYTVNNY
ncbi:MAG: type II toxin-antitoxin system HigB family toxin [Bacteroidetes bacterium]|nr:type II toxin-antitoxin system HigB family toxin [Bacteroidota bacterium]